MIWKHLQLPKPTKVQYEIAQLLNDTSSNLLIEAFRGLGKSWITSAYVVWRLLRNNQLEIMVVSATGTRAEEFTRFTKTLISTVPLLKETLEPEDVGTQRGVSRWSQWRFDVKGKIASHSPSVKSVGIFGQLTGSRADIIIADDIEIPSNSATVDLRNKLLKATNEFTNVLKPKGQVIYLGTPQSEESIYNIIRHRKGENTDTRNYVTRIWTVQYPGDVDIYGGDLAPSITENLQTGKAQPGDPTDPMRFNKLVISQKRSEIGTKEFALQYMLDTTLADVEKYPLKLKNLIVSELSSTKGPLEIVHSSDMSNRLTEVPQVGFTGDSFYRSLKESTVSDWKDYETKIMVIDISGRGSDETAYVILGKLFSRLFLLDVGGFQGGYEDLVLFKLGRLAQEYDVDTVVIEENFGDGMFSKLFTPVLLKYQRAGIEEVKNHSQKEKRIIDTLEPFINRHKLIVDKKALVSDIESTKDNPTYSLWYQMTRITYDRGCLKHDDRLDALAIGVRYFVDAMDQDDDSLLKKHKDAAVMRAWDDLSDMLKGGVSISQTVPCCRDLRSRYTKGKKW